MADHYDFRSTAVDRHRDVERTKKWKSSKGVPVVTTRNGTDRIVPEKARSAQYKKADKRQGCGGHTQIHGKVCHRKQQAVVIDSPNDHYDDDSPDSDRYLQDSTGTAADIMYSYDANRGPSPLDAVFEQAVNKAVDKYEDGQTTKLVKNEYEVLDTVDDDHGHSCTMQCSTDSDDDFELI